MGIAEEVRADPLFRDRYDLGDPLGSGGMGTVHKGFQKALGRSVAIKLMSPQLVGTEELQQRFKAEAQLAAGVIHSNVTAVFDFGIAGTIPYLVTELVEGRALSDVLQTGRLSVSQVLSITGQVLDGLGAIHALGIVHRDLKPSNLMVRMGDPPRAKILDFGLAKQVARLDGPQTMVGAIVGTPAYMAPEQVVHDPVCPATDLYALTIILYEMILGARPFESESVMDLVQMQMHQAPAIPPTLLAPVRRLLAWGLAKRPADRIPDAQTYQGAIEDLRRVAEPLASFWDAAAGEATVAPGGAPPMTPAQMARIASGPRVGSPAPVPVPAPATARAIAQAPGIATAMLPPPAASSAPPPLPPQRAPGGASATMPIGPVASPVPLPPSTRRDAPTPAGSSGPPKGKPSGSGGLAMRPSPYPPPAPIAPHSPAPSTGPGLGLLIGISALGAIVGASALAFLLKRTPSQPLRPSPIVSASKRARPHPTVAPSPRPPTEPSLPEVIHLARQMKVYAAATMMSEYLHNNQKLLDVPFIQLAANPLIQNVDRTFMVLFQAGLVATPEKLRPGDGQASTAHDALADLVEKLGGPLQRDEYRQIPLLINGYFKEQASIHTSMEPSGKAEVLHMANALKWLIATSNAGTAQDVNALMAAMNGLQITFMAHAKQPIGYWSAQILAQISVLAQDNSNAADHHRDHEGLRQTLTDDPWGTNWSPIDDYVHRVSEQLARNWSDVARRDTNPPDLRRAMLLTFVEFEICGAIRPDGQLPSRPPWHPNMVDRLKDLLGPPSPLGLAAPVSRQGLVALAMDLPRSPRYPHTPLYMQHLIDEVRRDDASQRPTIVPLIRRSPPAGSENTRRGRLRDHLGQRAPRNRAR